MRDRSCRRRRQGEAWPPLLPGDPGLPVAACEGRVRAGAGATGCAGELASSLGLAAKLTGSASPGFLIFAALALIALIGLTMVKARWRTTWEAAAQGIRI